MDDLSKCRGFQWDEGNAEKNWIKHRVSRVEIEQAFFNHPLVVAEGEKGSDREPRNRSLAYIIHEHLTAGPRRAVCKGIARYVPSIPVTHRAAALHPSLDPPSFVRRGAGR